MIRAVEIVLEAVVTDEEMSGMLSRLRAVSTRFESERARRSSGERMGFAAKAAKPCS